MGSAEKKSDRTPPYWVLMSVLFSSVPLQQALAMMLCDAAFELHRTQGAYSDVGGDFASGRVTNLKQDAVLGSIAGPAFEAKLELPTGAATVRFLLTRAGLELMDAREKKPQYLN